MRFIRKYKKYFLPIVFVILVIYSVNSVTSIIKWISTDSNQEIQYDILQAKHKQIKEEIEALTFKTNGLKQESLNKDLLETQAKAILNLSKQKEITIIH